MHVASLYFKAESGWSAPLPALDGDATAVFVFGSPTLGDAGSSLRHALLELRERFPKARFLGCSTAGEIHGSTIRDDSLSVAIVRFDRTAVRAASAAVGEGSDGFTAGEQIAHQLTSQPGDEPLRAVLVLSDGIHVNGSELIRGLNAHLPASVVVTGGLAGDGSRFKATWVLSEGVPVAARVTALGLYGDSVRVGHGSQGGWDIFGPQRRVTRSKGNVLFELDGKPALELYKRYLGDQAAGLPSTGLLFPLSLRASVQDDKTLVRTVLSVDEATSSLTFAGDLPEGSFVTLMRANMERLIDGASAAAEKTVGASPPGGESVSIAISCVGRRLVLGERTEEELEAALQVLPKNTYLVGFYSYGEISPYAMGGACDLHNQTMTLTSIWEA